VLARYAKVCFGYIQVMSNNKTNNMKVILILFTTIFNLNSFSQSKKELIQILNNRVDSLNSVLNSEKNTSSEKSNKISYLTVKITDQESTINTLNTNVSQLKSELQTSNFRINTLKLQIDSLNSVIESNSQKIVFVRNNSLYIFNLQTNRESVLHNSGKVIAFCSKLRTIYFSEINESKLEVYEIDLSNTSKKTKIVSINEKRDFDRDCFNCSKYFYDDYSNSTKGELFIVDDELIVGALPLSMEGGTMFTEHYTLKNKNKTYTETYFDENHEIPLQSHNDSKEFEVASTKRNEYFIKKAPVEYELFRSISANESIKISKTQLFADRNCGSDDFNYFKLPNNKIIFGFSRLCGSDTRDEVLFLVNNDGSYQQTLYDGFVGIEFLWQVVNGSLITWTEDGNLLEYFGEENKMKKLIEGKICEIEFINFN